MSTSAPQPLKEQTVCPVTGEKLGAHGPAIPVEVVREFTEKPTFLQKSLPSDSGATHFSRDHLRVLPGVCGQGEKRPQPVHPGGLRGAPRAASCRGEVHVTALVWARPAGA